MDLPSFLVIGAQRAGTTLLHEMLAAHPDIFVPTRRKEVHYFDRYYARGRKWYAGYFPTERAGQQYAAVGEVTPDYLAHPEVPARIHTTLPDCRLIAILRDPVARAFSWYQYSRRNRGEQRSFESFLADDDSAVEYGRYHKHLSRYWALSPSHPLLVLLYEDLVVEPRQAAEAVAGFLELNNPFPDLSGLLARRSNAAIVPRHRGAFAVARRLGGYLMRNDINWPSRAAKALGVRAWFGREAQTPVLDAATRSRVSILFTDDAVKLGRVLNRDLIAFWRLDPMFAG